MKKIFSYTKYQNLKTQIDLYKDRLSRMDDTIEKRRLLWNEAIRKKDELKLKLKIANNKIAKIREDYLIPVKKPEGGKVTNTPLPKRWRKKE